MSKKSFIESCVDMTELIESCWDENNPEDGGGYTTKYVPKLVGTSKVYNVYHKCNNCNLEEFLYEK